MTVKERAENYFIDAVDPDEILPARAGHLVNCYREGYVIGANEQKEIDDENLAEVKTAYEEVIKQKDALLADAISNFHWHPYPEETPENGNRYFVCISFKYYESRMYEEDTFGLCDDAVQYWMPIPSILGDAK